MRPILGMVIPPNLEVSCELVIFEPDDVGFIQGQVGGFFETTASDALGATLWINARTKRQEHELNHRAMSILWQDYKWRGTEMVGGSVLTTGPLGEDGRPTDVPEALLDAVGGMYVWRFEIEMGGQWQANNDVYDDYFEAASKAINLAQRWLAVTNVRVVRA